MSMLSSLIQNGFLYSKPLISDIQSVLSSTDDILDIPEADLWGWKKDNDDTEDPKNKKEDATESAEEADDESDEEEVREKTGEPT